MRRVLRTLLITLPGTLLLCWCACTFDPVSGGTSTSENGRIAGTVVDAEGAAVIHAMVLLLDAAHDPVKSTAAIAADTTDSSGAWQFDNVDSGAYTIEIVHSDVQTRALVRDISVRGDTVVRKADTLRRPGALRVALPDSVDTVAGYLYLPGSTVSVRLAGAGLYAQLDPVPVGTILAVAYSTDERQDASLWEEEVVVRQNDTATIIRTGWRHAREILLNTSASGADVAGTVTRFPVLVRLTEATFGFSAAMRNGDDLLFTRKNGTILPHETARWDAGNRMADVWVLMDTIIGNNRSGNAITMYWGNRRSRPELRRGRVFNAASGFLAAWHFEDEGDSLLDATGNGYHGVSYGTPVRTPGVIGYARRLDGTSWYDMGNVLDMGNTSYTVSAWVQRSTTGLQTIIAKSTGQEPSATYGWNLIIGESNELHLYTASGGAQWGDAGTFNFRANDEAALTATSQWYHLVAVVDRTSGAACKTYVNGVDVTGNFEGDMTLSGTPRNNNPLRIGAESDGDYPWTGIIDECTIAPVARSAAWVRLSFINQGPAGRLVEFR